MEQPTGKKVHIGVVGSGDLEVPMFPTEKAESTVKIYTENDGFGEVWNNVLTRFLDRYPTSANIVINDPGVTPGVMYL